MTATTDSTTDYTLDPNNAAKTAVATALGEIPEAGALLEALVEIFWPESENDVWDQIEQRVEELVQRDLSDSVFRQTQSDLTGLMNVLNDYTENAKAGHTAEVTSEYWHSAQTQFHWLAGNAVTWRAQAS